MTGVESVKIRRPAYRLVQFITWLIVRMLFRVRVEGVENIPREGGVLIASNHASYTDPPTLGCLIPREISYFAKLELFSVPLVGAFIAWANGIPVDRFGDSSGALKEMIRRLKNGWAVLVFPEGTRTRTGEFIEPKSGAGMAAVMAETPVVPCWVEGSFAAKPFRSRITVHFLPPFHPEEIEAKTKKDHYLLVSRRIMDDIIRLSNSRMAVRNQAEFKEM
jgi:1-acyl-sn-glycerol-3-phosphate acyltransferase